MVVRVIPTKAWWVALTLTCFTVFAHGAAPPGNTSEKSDQKTDSLAGTTWSGPDSDGDDYVYTFERDGTLSYKSPSGSYKNGTWKQSGNAVYFETKSHFSEYLAEVSGKTMKGRAWNTQGREWTWKATKDK